MPKGLAVEGFVWLNNSELGSGAHKPTKAISARFLEGHFALAVLYSPSSTLSAIVCYPGLVVRVIPYTPNYLIIVQLYILT